MLRKNGKEITSFYYGKTQIIEMYRGKYLVYQAIRSCFGNGYWNGSKPWYSTDVWKNN